MQRSKGLLQGSFLKPFVSEYCCFVDVDVCFINLFFGLSTCAVAKYLLDIESDVWCFGSMADSQCRLSFSSLDF